MDSNAGNKIKAILVDDEEAARNVLSYLLERNCPQVELLAMSANVPDAVAQIKALQPDLVFLDVQMPEYAGYEIVDFFEEVNFEIIFTTAYDSYAMKAFELSAVDYLLKPIKKVRLVEAVEKVQGKMMAEAQAEQYKVLMESLKAKEFEKIVIHEVGMKRVLQLRDIIAIEGEGAYSVVHLQNEAPLTVSKNLKYFESVLPENGQFFRSHKSWLINLGHLLTYTTATGEVVLAGQLSARLSKYRVEDFEKAIGNG